MKVNASRLLYILHYLRQKPRPPFALVDPNLDQTGGRDIVVSIAHLVYGAQAPRQLLVVVAQLADHLLRTHSFLVVVFESLVASDITDRTDRRPADFPRAFRDRIRYGENLARLFVEQQVIIAEVPAAYMPVKVLRLHVKREHVRKQSTQVTRYFLNRIPAEIRWCC